MNKIALGEDKKRIKFIITAIINETLNNEEGNIKDLKDELADFKNEMRINIDNMSI